MKLLVDALAEQGFHGPFSAAPGGVVDRTDHLVLIVVPTVASQAARTDLAEAVARGLNAQIAAEGRKAAA